MVRTLIRLVVVAVLMLLVVRVATERSAAQAPQGGVTALTGVRIIDGTGRAPIEQRLALYKEQSGKVDVITSPE